MRRWVCAAVVAALGGMAACAPARAQDAFAVKTLHVKVMVGPDDDVPCDVIGDVYTPAGVDRDHPAPAILTTNGFGGSKNGQADIARAYARRGYVVLTYSGLGFGGSTCKITLDDRDYDGKAGSQLVTFLAGGKAATDGTTIDYVLRDAVAHDGLPHAFDPRIGMIGGSYGGQIQFAIAGIDPRMDTIVPQITWSDLSYSLSPNNTSFFRGVSTETPGSAKLVWSLGFFATGVAGGVAALADDPARVLPCPNFADFACLSLLQTGALGGPNDNTVAALRHASVASFSDEIRIPTLLVQGQADTLFNLQEAVATYRALRVRGVAVKMVWRSAGHSGGGISGESAGNLDKPNYEGTTYLQWFDHYLKGKSPAPSLDFSFYRNWVDFPKGDATTAYARAASYPIGRNADWALSGDGTMTEDRTQVRSGRRTFLTTVAGVGTSYSELSIADPGAQPVDVPGTSTRFTGAPLQRDIDVVGVPTLDLRFSAPLHEQTAGVGNPLELLVYVRLEDVAADGTVTLPRKLVSPVRIAQPELPVHIELPGIVHRFRKGHRLRLVVYGGDLAYRGGIVPGPVSVLTDRARPGLLRLPVTRDGVDYEPIIRSSAPHACSSHRSVTLHLKRRYRASLRSARVVVRGKTVGRFTPKRTAVRVRLSGRNPVLVRIVMRTRSGRTVVDTRRFRLCLPRGF
jgi:hypothetical protein